MEANEYSIELIESLIRWFYSAMDHFESFAIYTTFVDFFSVLGQYDRLVFILSHIIQFWWTNSVFLENNVGNVNVVSCHIQ